MKEYTVKVYMPEGKTCNSPGEMCQFYNACYCLLFHDIMSSDGSDDFKLNECPSNPGDD